MADHFGKAGFGLRVYNRTTEKARPLLEQGATLARSPACASGRARRSSEWDIRQTSGPSG